MVTNESIRFAGDVNVDSIVITSLNGFTVDVTNQVIGIEIFEDLFSPFISGNLSFKESLDFANLVPLTGEEFVKIKIRTPSFVGKAKTIDDEFYLYKLSDKEMLGDKNQIYRLYFISKEAVVDLNKKISKAFSGKISDIAKTLLTDVTFGLETDKIGTVQETSNSVKYVSNFWSPVKNLNYLVETACNNRDNPDYVFFQNRLGYNFVSLESLYYQPQPAQEFIYDSWFREFDSQGRSIRRVDEEYKRIVEYRSQESYDFLDNNRHGMMSSKLVTFDIVTKKYTVKNFSMLDDFYKHQHLNQYPLISKKSIHRPWSTVISYPKYYNNFDRFSDVTNARTLQKRVSLIQQAEGNKIQITVPGRTDYTVGMKVKVQLNKAQPLSVKDDDFYDKVLSGYYLVSAINHFITREKHECQMELIKDSYTINLDTGGKNR